MFIRRPGWFVAFKSIWKGFAWKRKNYSRILGGSVLWIFLFGIPIIANGQLCGGVLCDDGNSCTVDSCDATNNACLFDPLPMQGMACDDQRSCSSNDICQAGMCIGTCDDGNPCNGVEICDDVSGQCLAGIPPPNGTICDDSNACTIGDVCSLGICTGNPRVCDDGNACNGIESCNAITGACDLGIQLPNGAACTDNDVCTVGDICDLGFCSNTPRDCDDGKSCTADNCGPNGCSHIEMCDDGNVCTIEACGASGDCEYQVNPTCDDNNPCTTNDCDELGNCNFVQINCDDGDACTIDSCDGSGNCQHETMQCPDDQNACTIEFCSAGSCGQYNAEVGTVCGVDQICGSYGECGLPKLQLAGVWPQSSRARFQPLGQITLADNYQLWRDFASVHQDAPSGGFGFPSCERNQLCDGTCGLSHDSNISFSGSDYHYVENTYVVAPDNDSIYVGFDYNRSDQCERADNSSCEENKSKVVKLDTKIGGSDRLDFSSSNEIKVADHFDQIENLISNSQFPGQGLNLRLRHFDIDDMLYVSDETGRNYLLLLSWALIAIPSVSGDFDQAFHMVIALNSTSGTFEWMNLVTLGDHTTSASSRERNRINVTPDGELLVMATSYISGRASRQLFRAPMPNANSGQNFELGIPVELPAIDPDVDQTNLLDFALDDVGRLYTLRQFTYDIDAPACSIASVTLDTVRLQIFDRDFENLLSDIPSTLESEFRRPVLAVEKANDISSGSYYRVISFGSNSWPRVAGNDVAHQYKSPYRFTEFEEHPNRCPERFKQACAQRFPQPEEGLGDCCLPSRTRGCSNPGVEAEVCQTMPQCCSGPWTEQCVAATNACPTIDNSVTDCPCVGQCLQAGPGFAGASNITHMAEVATVVEDVTGTTLSLVEQKAISLPLAPPSAEQIAMDDYGNLLLPHFEKIFRLQNDLGNSRHEPLPMPPVDVLVSAGDASPTDTSFVSVGSHSLLTGKTGDVTQLSSRLYLRPNAHSNLGRSLVPIGESRLLLYEHNSFQLLLPTTEMTNGEIAVPESDQNPPIVQTCPNTLCPSASPDPCFLDAFCDHDLDLNVETDAYQEGLIVPQNTSPFLTRSGWVNCRKLRHRKLFQRAPNGSLTYISEDPPETNTCADVDLKQEWEARFSSGGLTGFPIDKQISVNKGAIRLLCVSPEIREPGPEVSRISIPQNRVIEETEDWKYFRCAKWREVFTTANGTSDTGFAFLTTTPEVDLGEPQCPDWGKPVAYRLLEVDGNGPPQVDVRDTAGNDTASIQIGESVSLNVRELFPGNTAQYELVSGAANLTVSGSTAVVTANASGLIVIGVQQCNPGTGGCSALAFPPAYVLLRAFESDRPPQCTLSGNVYHHCDVTLPVPIKPKEDWPSVTSPAMTGYGVHLPDLSFTAHATDHTISSFGLPIDITRSYRSAHQPNSGGMLGGWTFGLDQRLAVIPGANGELSETDTDGLDIALQDGSGAINIFTFPDGASAPAIEEREFSEAQNPYYTYQPGLGLVSKSFRAKVVEYESPSGVFSQLRSYTLLPVPGNIPISIHPYAPGAQMSAATEILATDSRFYELTEPSGLSRIFGARGKLLKIIDPQYREIEFVYGSQRHPLSKRRELRTVIDTAGRRHQIGWRNYNGIRRIRTLTMDLGAGQRQRIRYSYRLFGSSGALLSQVRIEFTDFNNPEKNVSQATRYFYTPEGLLEKIVEAGFNDDEPALTNVYSSDGRIEQQIIGDISQDVLAGDYADLKGGGIFRYVPSTTDPEKVSVVDPNGSQTEYTLTPQDPNERSPKVVKSTSVNVEIYNPTSPAGLQPQRSQQLVTTEFVHNKDGLIEKVIRADASIIDIEYDEFGQVTSRRNPVRNNGVQRKWLTRYEAFRWPDGRLRCSLKTQDDYPGQSPIGYKYFEFDKNDPGRNCLVRRVEPPRVSVNGTDYSFVDVYDYQKSGPLRGALLVHAIQSPAPPDDPNNVSLDYVNTAGVRVTGYDYQPYLKASDIERKTQRSGKIRFTKLGHLNKMLQKGSPPGQCDASAGLESTTMYKTDVRGNVTEAKMVRPGQDLMTRSIYDMKDRLIQKLIDPDGLAVKAFYEWDSRNNVIKEITHLEDHFASGDVGGLITPASPRVLERRYFFDRLGRKFAETIGEDGAVKSFRISGFDGAGNEVAALRPGSGADYTIGSTTSGWANRVVSDIETGTMTAREFFGRYGVSSLNNNFANSSGGPIARNPRSVEDRFTYDETNQLITSITSDGGDSLNVCPSGLNCLASHERVREYYRDNLGRLTLLDEGRTDLQDASGQAASVFKRLRYTNDDLLAEEQLIDPAGCAGSATVIQRKSFAYDIDGSRPTKIEVRGDDGQVRSFATSPNLEEAQQCVTDKVLSTTVYEYDQLGRYGMEEEWQHNTNSTDPNPVPKRSTYTIYDFEDRALQIERKGSQFYPHESTKYAYTHRGEQCWEADIPGHGVTAIEPIREQKRVYDAVGLLIGTEEIHHSPSSILGPPIRMRKSFRYDRLQRLSEEIQHLGATGELRNRMFYDSLNRIRVTQDPDGLFHENRFDSLGNNNYTATITSFGERKGSRMTYSPSNHLLNVKLFIQSATGSETVQSEKRHDFDAFGNSVRVYAHGFSDNRFVDRLYNEAGNLLWRKSLNGTIFNYKSNAAGRTTEIVATPPMPRPVGLIPDDQISTRVKSFRYNGIGQLVAAKNFDLEGTTNTRVPISTVLFGYDSYSNVKQERQIHHVEDYTRCQPTCAAGNQCIGRECVFNFLLDPELSKSYDQQVDSDYDVDGYQTKLTYNRFDNESPVLDYDFGSFGRLYSIKPVRGVEALQQINYQYRGDFLSEREMWVPGPVTILRTKYKFNELGQRYELNHNLGLGYTHTKYWKGTREVLSASYMGTVRHPLPDRAPLLSSTVMRMVGKSHFSDAGDWNSCRNPYRNNVPEIYKQMDTYEDYPGHAWPSVYRSNCYDESGTMRYSLSTTYQPVTGKPSLHATWREVEGNRLQWEQSTSFDPVFRWDPAPIIGVVNPIARIPVKYPLDVRHIEFDYANQSSGNFSGSRVTSTNHYLLKEPRDISHLRELPLSLNSSNGKLENANLSLSPENTESYEFDYTLDGSLEHDGRLTDYTTDDPPPVPHGSQPRYKYEYDLFGQLVRVLDIEPSLCSNGPPFVTRRIAPLSGSMRIQYDALNRRIEVGHLLPDGCSGVSSNEFSQRYRRFFYNGTQLISENIYSGFGENVLGQTNYINGVQNTVPYVSFVGHSRQLVSPSPGVAQTLSWEFPFIALEDLNGSVVGFYDLVENKKMSVVPEYPHYQSYPKMAKGLWEIPVRMTSTNSESEGFGNLTHIRSNGYVANNRANRISGHWHAEKDYDEMIFTSRLKSVVEIGTALSVATATAPIVGDVIGFASDMANIGFQLYVNGPSASVVPELFASVAFAALAVQSTAAGPAGRAGAAGGRAIRAERAAKNLSKMVDTASQAKRTRSVQSLARNADGKLSTPRALSKLDDVEQAKGAIRTPGGGCIRKCFAAGTLIKTERGKLPIETLSPGDRVWSTVDGGKSLRLSPIKETFSRIADKTLLIGTSTEGGITEVLQVTSEHPFWVVGRSWVSAGELQIGDILRSSLGKTVVSSIASAGMTYVYNFEVTDSRNYFVGENEVLVHNTSSPITCSLVDSLSTARNRVDDVLEARNRPRSDRIGMVDNGTMSHSIVVLDDDSVIDIFTTARMSLFRRRMGDDFASSVFLDHRLLQHEGDFAGLTGRALSSARYRQLRDLLVPLGFSPGRALYHAEAKFATVLHALVPAVSLSGRNVKAIHMIVDRLPCKSCRTGLGLGDVVRVGRNQVGTQPGTIASMFDRFDVSRIPQIAGRNDPSKGFWMVSFYR